MSLEDLLKRVESCSGPDRALDLSICEALGQPQGWSGDLQGLGSAHYTSSLDAALALVEEKLPGCDIDIYRCDSPLWACELAHPSTASHSAFGCASPCIAVLSALLRALISQKEGVE